MHKRFVWRHRVSNASLVALVFLWWSVPPLVCSETTVAVEQLEPQHEVSGTLAKLDLTAGKGMLMTDLQKPIFFRLDRPELFERLSVGDRVTMQLDGEGRVLKVIETLPAEVHEPPPPPK